MLSALRFRFSVLLSVIVFSLLPAVAAAAQTTGPTISPQPPVILVNATTPGSESQATPRTDTSHITVGKNGWTVSIDGGPASWPGVDIKKTDTPWDLSKYGIVEAVVTNTSSKRIAISLGVAGTDWNRTSSELIRLEPGKSGTIRVYLGLSFGKPVSAFPQNAITNISLITGKTDVPLSFEIEKVTASGNAGDKPPVDLRTQRVQPPNGVMLGGAVAIEQKQLQATGGAKATLANEGKAIAIDFSGGKVEGITLKPTNGMWNLGYSMEVRVKVKNVGTTSFTPAVRVESRDGPTTPYSTPTPLAPGAEGEVAVSFLATTPWVGDVDPLQNTLEAKKIWTGVPGTGTTFTSQTTTGISVLSDPKNPAGKLLITSVIADMPAPTVLPDWAGKRPPVDGDWKMSFHEEFDGPTLNPDIWKPYTAAWLFNQPNYHLSKDQITFKDGKAIMRIEKKHGRQNDAADGRESDYAGAYMDSFGHWRQRYGYFETRVKLPTAPNSYICWWLMPDRGSAAGTFDKRAGTKDGGMEFDIMEHLAIWGPYRADFGDHWDGYVKYHKSNGDFSNYFVPDKDGFMTFGLLWLPGKVVYYTNGKEVGRWESPRISNQPSFMIYNNVPGGWDTEAMDDSKLPSDLVVDYIRVWQRKDLASSVDGFRKDSTDDH